VFERRLPFVPASNAAGGLRMVMSLQSTEYIEAHYEILGKLHEGGMGSIYKVRHRLLQEIRVIKVMKPDFVKEEQAKERFLREAQVAVKLRHPNIAQLFDFSIEKGTAFMVIEFIDGEDLREILTKKGPPSVDKAVQIANQALRALGYLHYKGFVHRDISPDNLMVTKDEKGRLLVKLIDLGIAKSLEEGALTGGLTSKGDFVGKLHYASPEHFGGALAEDPVDARSDLYSFGVVLYELLTGKYPISGTGSSSLLAGHLHFPPLSFDKSDPDGRIPVGLREVVMKVLSKSPDDRFQSAEELSQSLMKSVKKEPKETVILPAPVVRPVLDQQQVTSLLDTANKLASLREYEDAKKQLQTILESDPGHQEVHELLKKIEREAQQWHAKVQEETQELARITEEISQSVAAGDVKRAQTGLKEARSAFGDREEVQNLQRQVQQAEDQQRDDQLQILLKDARRLLAARKTEAAAEKLRAARILDPLSEAVQSLSAEVAAASTPDRADRQKATRAGRPVVIAAVLAVTVALVVLVTWLRSQGSEATGLAITQSVISEMLQSGGAERMGRYYGLVIGNNEYMNGITRLETAVPDAVELAGLLEESYGFEMVTLSNATRDEIFEAVESVAQSAGEQDSLLIFYAGHGFVDSAVGRAYWQPVDAEPVNTATWISSLEIKDILLDTHARRVLVIADSCFSGAFAYDERRLVPKLEQIKRAEDVEPLLAKRSQQYIASGGEEPVVDDGGGDHSIFARALLEVLGANTEIMDSAMIFEAVVSEVQLAADRLGLNQLPEHGVLESDDGGVFLFIPQDRS
jgi:serine/threonine protein kinase